MKHNSLDLFMLNAADQLGDGDFSGDQITGADFECVCAEIDGLHYEWDHRKPRPGTPGKPTKIESGAAPREGK